MNFLVGYQLMEKDLFLEEIIRRKNQIGEIYFSYGDLPNGRHASGLHVSLPKWEARARMDEDLSVLRDNGFNFNLLLNGNCYGGVALSRNFLIDVLETVDEVAEKFTLSSITTTSPVLARAVKDNFPSLEIRASVNMELRTIEGMEYLADTFDGFYIGRELNRNIPQLKNLRNWCLKNGKKSYILANSGCLNFCSARQFHDNLVAHEKEIAAMDNAVNFKGICADYFKNSADTSLYLRRLNFIRPEDLSLFEGLADGVKLATRVNFNPTQVLKAYAEGSFSGNLLELLEPNHAERFYPNVLENSKIPPEFSQTAYFCGGKCDENNCNVCKKSAKTATAHLPDAYFLDDSKKECK